MVLKYIAAIGALLLLLLGFVALVVDEETSAALTREVGGRAEAVARDLAGKVGTPLATGDELTLKQLLKAALEEAPPPPAPAVGFLDRVLGDLKAGFSSSPKARNEGLIQVLVLRPARNAGEQAQVYAYDAVSGKALDLTPSQLPAQTEAAGPTDQPYPGAQVDGRPVYVFTQNATVAGQVLGEVRLYLRQDVVADALRVATTRLAAVMLVSMALGLLLLAAAVGLLLRPIGPLVRGVNAVAAGDFQKRLDIRRRDELGELVDAYNGMAKSLAEKESVQGALAKYTSQDLVERMLSDGAPLDLGGSKVHATVLFSVVRGIHALSQTLPAERYVALINEYLEVETAAIMRHHGSIDKFIGDEVMAVWLIPKESPLEKRREAAVRAVRAALEAQEGIDRLNAERVRRGEQAFQVSIGINNGEVVSGNMGSPSKMDYTVLGGNVNLAARLGLVAAQGGQTLLSESVYGLVQDHFEIDRLPAVPLKGIKEPVPLFWPRRARETGGRP